MTIGIYESLRRKYPERALRKVFPSLPKKTINESSGGVDYYYRYFKELEDYVYEFRGKPKLFMPVMKGLDADQMKRSPKYSNSDATKSLDYLERIIDLFERYALKLSRKEEKELVKNLDKIPYKNFAQFVEKVYGTVVDFLSKASREKR